MNDMRSVRWQSNLGLAESIITGYPWG